MRLFSELQRRNVFRVAALYVVSAWLVLQVAGVLADLLPLPGWFGPVVLAALVAGFPVAFLIAWFYKLTPKGISRESDAGDEISIRQVTGRRMDFIIIAVLAAALIVFGIEIFNSPSTAEGVCVLPFDNLGDDPREMAIAAGFAEEIHHQLLAQGKEKVLPRNSCIALRQEGENEHAEELGVGYVVEGSFRHSNERVRIAVQLVQVADGMHCWSRVYDEDLGDEVSILDLQARIAESVVAEMHIPCIPGQEAQPDPVRTTNEEARRLYLLGMQRLEKSVSAQNPEAAGYFRKAFELDPEFADAYAGLAFAIAGEPLRRRELSLRALNLDSQLGLARATLAASYESQDPRRARTEFDRALELDEEDPLIRELFGDYVIEIGNLDQGLELYQSGIELNPLAIRLYYKTACLLDAIGRAKEAQDYRDKAADVDPDADLSCGDNTQEQPGSLDAAASTS